MRRRTFVGSALAAGAMPPLALPQGPQPLAEPHFPSRLHQFVWRNWEVANLDRMAQVVKATPEQLRALGEAMGLPPKPQLSGDQLRRIYISVIRQNWHLLPNEQLIALLGWTHEKFEFTLKEDDFLDHKLGPKPACEPVTYHEPTAEERRRAAEMRRTVQSALGKDLTAPGEPAFHFVERLSSMQFEPRRISSARAAEEQVDLTDWRVEASPGVEPRVAERLTEYLRTAMRANPGSRGGLSLRIEPSAQERFAAEFAQGKGQLTGTSLGSLMQAIYWLQHQMESSGGPFLHERHFERRLPGPALSLLVLRALRRSRCSNPTSIPFPDGYLEKLAHVGINGVWMQCVLSTMAPSPRPFRNSERRRRSGWQICASWSPRAKRSGMKIYLYINEPRSHAGRIFPQPARRSAAPNRAASMPCAPRPAGASRLDLRQPGARLPACAGAGRRVLHHDVGEPDQLLLQIPSRNLPALLERTVGTTSAKWSRLSAPASAVPARLPSDRLGLGLARGSLPRT